MVAVRRLLSVLLVGFLAAGCASRRAAPFVATPFPLLTWLGESTKPANTAYPQFQTGTRFGSLSGLAPDAESQQWVGVIDDREHTRVAWLAVDYSGKGLNVTPVRMQELKPGPGVPAQVVTEADLEAIVALPDGTFVMSEEGHRVVGRPETWEPRLLHANRDGTVTDLIEFPKAFRLSVDGKKGVRDNKGFEALAITPSAHLIAGLEGPLLQDGAVTFERGAPGRLVEFARQGRTYRPTKQYRYMISPTPRVEGFDEVCSDGENGLVELLALSDTRLLSMERACLVNPDTHFVTNPIQLFVVELSGGEARKRLLLDFKDVQPRLSAALSRLENFEGMTFGPIVNGVKTLLIVSDDNFRPEQKTAFLLFGMR